MLFSATTEGTHLRYKDWGSGQPIVFGHGWPLSITGAVHVGHSTRGGEVARVHDAQG